MSVKTVSPVSSLTEHVSLSLKGKPVEVLLIEDNPGDAILVEEALKDGKILVNLTVVEDGEVAVKFLTKEAPYANSPKPDLVILDLNLPKMNGHQILEAIRAVDGLKQIPIVVLTTSNVDSDIKKAYELGATCFITKPFGFYNFIQAIKSIEHFWLNVVSLPQK
jgi:two-component system, chemotaxis family, response regulator Rcp1